MYPIFSWLFIKSDYWDPHFLNKILYFDFLLWKVRTELFHYHQNTHATCHIILSINLSLCVILVSSIITLLSCTILFSLELIVIFFVCSLCVHLLSQPQPLHQCSWELSRDISLSESRHLYTSTLLSCSSWSYLSRKSQLPQSDSALLLLCTGVPHIGSPIP